MARRISMFLEAHIYGMASFTTVCADLSIVVVGGFCISMILVWKTMFFEAGVFLMTNPIAVCASNSGRTVRLTGKIRRGNSFHTSSNMISHDMTFLLDNKRKNFRNWRKRVKKKNMRLYIGILGIQTSEKLHCTIFVFSLRKNRRNSARTFGFAYTDRIWAETIKFIPNDSEFGKEFGDRKFALGQVFDITKKDVPLSDDKDAGRFTFDESLIFLPGTTMLLLHDDVYQGIGIATTNANNT
ncbi:hypothetical protein V8G54_023274 [Vigna mungo]|uniref:Uncharacterized protein n=1 Tax=Vigna mungo TaxID=3915 RepID=A0AAQ3N3B4_VIGMU